MNLKIGVGEIYRPICGEKKCMKKEHMKWFNRRTEPKDSTLKRIQAKAVKSLDGCLIYPCKLKGKYAVIGYKNKSYYLHRLVFWLASNYETIQDMPKDLQVAHQCRNITCVNPLHYVLVTAFENAQHKIRDKTDISGARHPTTKLTLDKAQAIADSWQTMSIKDRCNKFEVSRSIVNKIDERVNWKEVIHPNKKIYDENIVERRRNNIQKSKNRVFTKEDIEHIKLRLKTLSKPIVGSLGTPCDEWLKCIPGKRPMLGYAYQQKLAARWACMVKTGYEDKTKYALHLCGRASCVNPDHLIWGDALTNSFHKIAHGTNGIKLKTQDVMDIRQSNKSSDELASLYSVTQGAINGIKAGRSWKRL